MSQLLTKICKTIEKNCMINAGDSILVALSGGADSVCLLTALCQLRGKFEITVYAAHLNHMLRGKDADDDEKFAENLCAKLNVPFFSKKADVNKFAKENSLTSEEAGRKLRYDFFSQLCEKHSIDKIATAHNSNDNAETVVMRFIRGTGIKGLSGIPYINGNIIRPLLDVSRKEIEGFLAENGQAFVTDKTNKEPLYFRNKVRLCLIPEIEKKYNPNFSETISSNITSYSSAADFLSKAADEKAKALINREKNYLYIDTEKLLKEHDYIISSVIINAIEMACVNKQITSKAINDIAEMAKKGRGLYEFSKELTVFAIYNKLYFVNNNPEPFSVVVEDFEKIYIPECDKLITFTNVSEKNKKGVYIDADKLSDKKITVRSRKDGDSFFPSGMKGKKKLKDFFIDEKIPVFLRDEIPVFLADDEIFCVGQMRVSENYKADKNTTSILKIEISDGGK